MSEHPRRPSASSSEILAAICAIALAFALVNAALGVYHDLRALRLIGVAFACAYAGVLYLLRRSPFPGLNPKPLSLAVVSAHCFCVALGNGVGEVQIAFLVVSLVVWLLMYHDVTTLRVVGAAHVAAAVLAIALSGGRVTPDPWLTLGVFVIVATAFAVASALSIRSNRAYWHRMADLEDELSRNELSLKRTAAQLAAQHATLSETSAQLRDTARANARQVSALTLALTEQSHIAQAASSGLRQPLRNINSFVQLVGRRLERLGCAAEVGEYLTFVTDGAARMTQMVDDLLRYSESPEPSAPASVDTAEVLRSIQRNLDDLFAREGGRLTFAPDLPTVSGQPTQVLQLFQNLVSNGIKFRRPGVVPTCHVACEVTDGVACFSVSDNGIGIPAARLKDVFGLFTCLHERGAYEGTGIGLATCRRIVIAAGGEIWAESTEGEGTTFRFTWPLNERTGAAVGAPGATATPRTAAAPSALETPR